MRTFLVHCALGVVCVLPVSASEPGQPLDCSDWVIDAPGLSCEPFVGFGLDQDDEIWSRGTNLATDNEGGILIAVRTGTQIEIRRRTPQGNQLLAHIDRRRAAATKLDWIDIRGDGDGMTRPGPDGVLTFAPISGRLLVPLVSYCEGQCECGSRCIETNGGRWVAAIAGFATLYELGQDYIPQRATVAFTVPAMPEGLPAADHFDTYWGDLSTVGDWSQAHGLQCNYPTTPPARGDHLTATDPLPRPRPGQGYYYVTAATYQGQTRYGRHGQGGVLSGRDPSLLPACTATAYDGATPISAPTTITQPGSYVLVADISAEDEVAIGLNASNVKLNLNGFAVGRTGTMAGAAISGGAEFSEIHGGEIVGGGIELGGSYNTIRDLTVRNASRGVILEGAQNIVERTRQYNSLIWMDDAHGVIVRDNVVVSGRIVIESGNEFQVAHNSVTDGDIWLDGDSNGVLLDNVVSRSPTHGIWGFGPGNRFAGNVLSGNAGFGLYLQSSSPDSTGCTYSGNVSRGNNGAGCPNPAGNADFCDAGTGNESGGDNFIPDLR